MTAADLLVRGLRQHGVEWITTLCGHGLDPLLNAARQAGLRLVDVRNEQTCAYLADAFGRLSRRPGVCVVSSGVALVNALAGVANSSFDCAPLLLISGAGPTATAGVGHFQDLDQVGLARPITRLSASIDDASCTLSLLDEAFAKALADPRGPVHLMFPLDVQATELGECDIDAVSSVALNNATTAPDVQGIARALAAAKSPLVIAGSEVFYKGSATEMLGLCTEFHIPVVTPIWDRGAVDQPSSIFLGVIGAATGGPAILSDADCILLAGAENDYRIGYLQPPFVRTDARIFRIGTEWKALAAECEKGRVKQDAAREAWLATCVRRRNDFRRAVEHRAEEQACQGLHAIHIIRAIEEVLIENPVLLIDGGSIGQWAHQLLCRDRYPGDWLTCGRSGVVGWGIGGAMGARLAFPRRRVILLSGDGAFTFNVADLESAVRQNLPFVAIVADDQAWGITRLGQIRQFGVPIASSLGPISFDRLALSLGAYGVRVSTPGAIVHEIRQAIDRPTVTVIHVPITGGNP
jgi:acetolactate synthase I/II/III large subunit